MSNLTFDPASLVQVEQLDPVSEKKTRTVGPKSQLKVVVHPEKRTRFYVGSELAEKLELGIGLNGFTVMTDPNNDSVLALNIVPEASAQLLGEAKSRKSRNFSCHAIESRLLLSGLIGITTGTYELKLENIEGTSYYIIEDNELIANELDEEVGPIEVKDVEFNPSKEDGHPVSVMSDSDIEQEELEIDEELELEEA